MDEKCTDPINDIAYGIFEHYLTKMLVREGIPLFLILEQGADFHEKFNLIFEKFMGEYNSLALALIQQFSSAETIYDMICNGEGVIPSLTTQMYWIIQDAPSTGPGSTEDENAGKWLIFVMPDEVDSKWVIVRNATWQGQLGTSSKVSTAKPNPESSGDKKVIYVYTRDWRDETDVMRVREHLRHIGFVDRLGYKRNIETFAGEYSKKGKRVTYYVA